MKPIESWTSRGVVAGIVGATVLALWFLVVDGLAGVPFRTPGFIAHALLDIEQVQPTAGPVVLYTLLHYAAWVVVGVAVAWVRAKVPTASPILLGLVLGIALFELVFYGSVIVTGVDIIAELGWPVVLTGNLVAGVSTLWVIHLSRPHPSRPWWASSFTDNPLVHEGVIAGLLGAAVVAAWFLIFDLGRGTPFFTPGALGSAIFLEAQSPSEIQVTLATVAGYTILHVLAFVVAGFVAAAFVAAAEDAPPLLVGAALFFAAFEAFFMGALAIVSEFLLGTLAWWTVATGNLIAAVWMGWYLWNRHPRLREASTGNPFESPDPEPAMATASAGDQGSAGS